MQQPFQGCFPRDSNSRDKYAFSAFYGPAVIPLGFLFLPRASGDTRDHRLLSPIPTLRSLTVQSTPAAAFPLPRIRRAPSVLFSENLSRAPSNASFTNPLLPLTAPSVKYHTRQRSIFAIFSSGRTVWLSPLSKASASFFEIPVFLEVSSLEFRVFRSNAIPISLR